jgi:hypothetical protein
MRRGDPTAGRSGETTSPTRASGSSAQLPACSGPGGAGGGGLSGGRRGCVSSTRSAPPSTPAEASGVGDATAISSGFVAVASGGRDPAHAEASAATPITGHPPRDLTRH